MTGAEEVEGGGLAGGGGLGVVVWGAGVTTGAGAWRSPQAASTSEASNAIETAAADCLPAGPRFMIFSFDPAAVVAIAVPERRAARSMPAAARRDESRARGAPQVPVHAIERAEARDDMLRRPARRGAAAFPIALPGTDQQIGDRATSTEGGELPGSTEGAPSRWRERDLSITWRLASERHEKLVQRLTAARARAWTRP
jgi:hypothetical protein